MDWRDYVRQQLSTVTGDHARDAEIVEELAQHLATRVDELRGAGLSQDQAQHQAMAELRSGPRLAAALRHADRQRPVAPVPPALTAGRLVTDLRADVVYALRLLRRTPGFTAAAMLTLALGIGMTTAIASVVEAVLLRPVPLPEPERLVMLWETDRPAGTTREPASLPDFVDYRRLARQVDRLGAFVSVDMDLLPDRGEPFRPSTLRASAELLPLLGVRTIAGRSFTAAEDTFGTAPVALISERLWEQLFARDPAAIGATVRLDGVRRTVVGVTTADADFGILQMLSAADYARGFADRDQRARVDVWLPLQPDPADTAHGSNHSFLMVGRLAAGASVATAQAEMTALAADLERHPGNQGRGAFVERVDEVVLGRTRTALSVLMAAVALVLVIACANVASLLLARGATRRREIAVRAAVGAELPRLARQFVVENVVLSLGGALLGVPLAMGVLRALTIVGPASIPRLGTVTLDMTVLLAALGAAALVGLAFGVLPLVQAHRVSLQAELHAGEDRASTDGPEGTRVRSALVVAEVALAVVLVSGAGLLVHSFWNLTRTSPGFDADGVLKAQFQLSATRFPRDRSIPRPTPVYDQFMSRVLTEVSAIPGVESAALAAFHPLDTGFTQSFFVPGRETEADSWPELTLRHVTADYFRTLRVPVVRGRLLTEEDAQESPAVIVINETTAKRFFPNQDPLGQQISFWGQARTIVGVAGDERFHGVARAAPIAAYVPLTRMSSLALIVRTGVDPVALAPAVRSAIRRIEPDMAVYGVEPLTDTLANTLGEQRFMMLLLGLFAVLAAVLAAIGVHGVLACLVAQRTREIGVRMALGASAGSVTRLVVRRGLRLVAAGIGLGLALTLALSGSLSGLLFGVEPADLRTLAAVIGFVAVVAALSFWLPTRRAARIDPIAALRQ
jgi:putative ABC transport system permease protein